ncbi:hypothetical protein [Okeania sp. SIO2B9]|uniref:hypothetical protein n=1 Tax=Okeania sp. SIO2B9 TaxID=2607782 RepID=UPI00142BA3B1|nr:hypothetical protein [Okeania sp. SIO2B9]NES92064.1 hypothetical protein [Okeania sp. SIO2B9]
MPYKDKEKHKRHNKYAKRKAYKRKTNTPYTITTRQAWFLQTYPDPDFSQLDIKEATVLKYFFGYGGSKVLALDDIGAMMGFSRTTAAKIRDRAFKKFADSNVSVQSR